MGELYDGTSDSPLNWPFGSVNIPDGAFTFTAALSTGAACSATVTVPLSG
jgi:hypothetical protein